MTAILPDILDEARRVLDEAERQGTTLALLGGIAVRLHASEVPPLLAREYHDIDFAVPKGSGRPAGDLLDSLGYDPAKEFNALQGRERLLYLDPEHGRQVDVFVGSFRMCHEIPFDGRLTPGQQTVPLAELVLTKLGTVADDHAQPRALPRAPGRLLAARRGCATHLRPARRPAREDRGPPEEPGLEAPREGRGTQALVRAARRGRLENPPFSGDARREASGATRMIQA